MLDFLVLGLSGGVRGELKHDGMESIMVEDMDDELLLELGLCSGALSLLLLGT